MNYSTAVAFAAVLAEGGHPSGYIYFSEVPPTMPAFETEHGPYFQSIGMGERTEVRYDAHNIYKCQCKMAAI